MVRVHLNIAGGCYSPRPVAVWAVGSTRTVNVDPVGHEAGHALAVRPIGRIPVVQVVAAGEGGQGLGAHLRVGRRAEAVRVGLIALKVLGKVGQAEPAGPTVLGWQVGVAVAAAVELRCGRHPVEGQTDRQG